MNYTNLFKIALRAIAANKMRSFLTALGIIIGVASVITMLAIGQGSKKSIQANIAEMGSNMIMIHPGADMRGGVRQDPSAMQTLKITDYQSIRDNCHYVKAVSPVVSKSGQWVYGNNNTQSSIYMVSIPNTWKYANLPWPMALVLRSMTSRHRPRCAYSDKRWLTIFFLTEATL